MTSRGFRAAAAMIVSLVTAATTHAQTTTAAISGVVTDANGKGVPRATVTATNIATNATVSTTSGSDGQYVLRGLPVGQYTLEVELKGFQTFQRTDITIRLNEELKLNPTLTVGAVNERITVIGRTGASVETTSGTLMTVVDRRLIESLPLPSRYPLPVILIVAGVAPDPTPTNSGSTYPGGMPVSSNGARGNAINSIVDGGSNNDNYTNAPNPMPNPDALQEINVQTNNFSAEYGRNVGAVVNALTRSGTNAVHGSTFVYGRDHRLNATNFFTPGIGDGLKRWQYGGTLGGPIKHNQTFFFLSYQGTNQHSTPRTSTALVPTAAQRAGDFSALSRPLRNPSTGQTFAGNQIPSSMLSPTALRILELVPLPNPGAGDNPNLLRFVVPVDANDHQWLARLDHRVSDAHRLYGRVWMSTASVPAYFEKGNALSASVGRTWQNAIVSVNDTYRIGPSMVNNLVVTLNRTTNDNFQNYPPNYSSLGIAGVYNDNTPQWVFSVAGYFNLNTGETSSFLRNEFQIIDTVRWTTARHELVTGVDYSYGQGDIVNNFRTNGRFTFNPGAPFTGDGLADIMIGKFQQFEQGIGEYKNTQAIFIALFAQDTFRVNSRLTLNVGLRWDPFIPYIDANDRLGVYRPDQQSTVYVNAPRGAVYPGDAGVPRAGYRASLRNVGPRVGIAYAPDRKTSIRGGYGIFYDKPNTISTNGPANQGPFGTVVRFAGDSANSLANPYAGRINPFPADPYNVPSDVTFTRPHTVVSYDEHMRNAQVQSWHVTVEREVLPTYLVRISYAGSEGDRLAMGRELNPAVFVPGATTATTDQRRPLFPDFASITSIEATGRSSYHSMQATLDKRWRRRFSMLASYTWSKALDDSSDNRQTVATVTNPFDVDFDWGPTNADRRHRFVASGLYALPGLPASLSNRALDAVVGGWSVSGIVTLQSGPPINITSGVDNARTGTGGQRADQIGDPELPSGRTRDAQVMQWFNTSAFVTNRLGTFGDETRNSLRGPGYANVDMGLHKQFQVTTQMKLEFRIEAFNVFNRVNLNVPISDRSSPSFGRILSAQDPRILQLALRTSF